MYEKKKEYYKQVWDVVSPHLIPALSVAISTALQLYTHKKNMQMQEEHHEDNMAMAREHFWMQTEQGEIHYEEQKEIGEAHHKESLSQGERHHKENLKQSGKWQLINWGTSVAGTAATIATGAKMAGAAALISPAVASGVMTTVLVVGTGGAAIAGIGLVCVGWNYYWNT
jgi:hypothetical protein